MKEEKIEKVKVFKKISKLIGTIVLVDSLIVGIVSLGGHTPIYRDDKKVNEVFETVYKKWDNTHELTVSNYYEGEVDTRAKIVYYQLPFETDKGRFRNVKTLYREPLGPTVEEKIVPVTDKDDVGQYIETYEYNINTDHYITVKETLRDELLSDTALLMLLGIVDTAIYAAGNNYLSRKEEKQLEKA